MSESNCCWNTCRSEIRTKDIKKDEYGLARSIRLCSTDRPHMRAFHASWFCFFLAFTAWFGIQPLLPTIIKELHLSKKDIANSGIASVAATIILRIFVGPLCDKFGPRRVMSMLLLSGSIPMALTGLIKNGTGLIILRLFIGVLGATFVPCQFWTTVMFNSKIVGSANALVGGWGNLGGGFTFLLMPVIFQLLMMIGADEFLAWKIAVSIPSFMCCCTGILILFSTDDSPQGTWGQRIKTSCISEQQTSMLTEAHTQQESEKTPEDIREKPDKFWPTVTLIILMLHYGMCFGVEIATNTVLNLYLLYKFKVEGCNETSVFLSTSNSSNVTIDVKDEFLCSVLNQNVASLIASVFGLMNLFARAMGGSFSDKLFKRFEIPGRLLAHQMCLTGEGVMLMIFSQMITIPSAVFVLVLTSILVQASEGTTYSIVPSVNKRRVGVVAGFVGAGGNIGAIIWNTLWVYFVDFDPSWWFLILGVIVVAGSALTVLIRIDGKTIKNLFASANY